MGIAFKGIFPEHGKAKRVNGHNGGLVKTGHRKTKQATDLIRIVLVLQKISKIVRCIFVTFLAGKNHQTVNQTLADS